ncbi:hypothetical protein IJ425_02880 [bacterium]|nr:hypothetical protein [bacterium]
MKASNVSFKGCMPMEFYAKYSRTGTYVPVAKPENVRKCQNFVVRNLNNTAGENRSDSFVKAYKEQDKDYRALPCARSIYDKRAPIITSIHDKPPAYSYLITGYDVETLDTLGKSFGYQKKDIFERTGVKKGRQVTDAKKQYKSGIKDVMDKLCKRVKDKDGDDIVMKVYFTPEFNRKGELLRFKYDEVAFSKQEK